MIDFCQMYQIQLHHSTPYYPQGNGLATSSNKSLVKVIKKVLAYHKRNWDIHLKYAVWEKKKFTKERIRSNIDNCGSEKNRFLDNIFGIRLAR